MIVERGQQKLSLREVRLNAGGYDRDGTYWGVGVPLWEFELPEEYATWNTHDYVRASSRSEAKQAVRDKFPKDYQISFHR